jgi:hypothetical protein
MTMGYNTRNHRSQGGESIHIGGEVILAATSKLTIEAGAVIEGLPGGTATPAAGQADSTAATIEDLAADFNTLLAGLRTAGLMEA